MIYAQRNGIKILLLRNLGLNNQLSTLFHGNCAGKEEASNDGGTVFRNNISEWYLLSWFVFRLGIQSLNLRLCIWDFVSETLYLRLCILRLCILRLCIQFRSDWYFCQRQLDLIEAGPWNKKVHKLHIQSFSPQQFTSEKPLCKLGNPDSRSPMW